ncbi:sialidase family protein [Dyella lutea]|uniref:Cellulase n=1 Tax=Dyella lutea TaxID=2950441 RepID=A0ABT1FCW0_9GAMM|nr:sialidase family protein [Dyella lutea]MCP1375206.1 cellulase [Dyella lutea]
MLRNIGITACAWFLSLSAYASQPASVPYHFGNVRIGGGGYVSGVLFHPAVRGLHYARTDVGGAYRWDEIRSRWQPLTDWIAAKDQNLFGIDSFAVDPSDPHWLYLAAGTYTTPQAGNAAILRSHDQGRSFQRVDLPFKLGGNELGRGNGERLAVDPNDGRVLFLGSRDAGLWRSDDHGAHWTRVAGFPAVATSPSASASNAWRTQPIGIVFVVFDPASGRHGRPTPVIYAGVSTRQTSLFRSTDGGHSWSALPGQPIGLRPSHMHRASDGDYYLSYGDEPGPDTMNDGALWRWQPATNRWTDITPIPGHGKPAGFGWGDVAVAPSNPAVLVASTHHHYNPHDLLFRSTDRGAHWTEVFAHSVFDRSEAPWTVEHTPHWMTAVAIDPFDPNHVIFGTGYGLWSTRDMGQLDHGSDVHWSFADRGLEETVPLGLISPPQGAHLLSALGDLDGYRHDDLAVAPLQFKAPPRYANSEAIDYAGLRPGRIVRSGYLREPFGPAVRAAWSADGGQHWRAFASEPPEGEGAGSIAWTADGEGVLWAPRHAKHVYLTRDFGYHWQAAAGLPGDLKVLGDRVDPRRCYAFDPRTGALYASHDGGVTFTPLVGELGAAARGRDQVQLQAAPDVAGRLYLAARDLPLTHGDDTGRVLQELPGITGVDAFGFGKSAPGRHAPVLFVAGRRGQTQGLFRSLDGGSHWQRINDDAHQYGRIRVLTGDPRVFGRVYLATGGRGIVYGDPKESTP